MKRLKYVICFKFDLKTNSNKHIIALLKVFHTFLCPVVALLLFSNPSTFNYPPGSSTPLMESLEATHVDVFVTLDDILIYIIIVCCCTPIGDVFFLLAGCLYCV